MTDVDLTGLPEWAHPGKAVVYMSGGHRYGSGRFVYNTTVARVTKTLIILANDARFRRPTDPNARQIVRTEGHGHDLYELLLVPRGHPAVATLRRIIQIVRVQYEVFEAHEVIRNRVQGTATIEEVTALRDAAQEWLDLLTEDGA